MSYPCKECIVSMMCQKVCDCLTYGNHLVEFFLTNKHCPDCKSDEIFTPPNWDTSMSSGSIICSKCRSIFYINLREGNMWRYSKCNTTALSYNWTDHKIRSVPDFVNHMLKPLLVRYRGSPR